MAKWKFQGLDEYIAQLEKLTNDREYIGPTIYEGAAVVADEMKKEINNIPVEMEYAPAGGKKRGITSVQKAGLQSGFGITKMKNDDGFYNVKLGFNGYNGQKTKKYPNGQPNSVIARSLVSGTSFRKKNDFVGRATRSKKAQAEMLMQKKLDDEIRKRVK